MLKVAVIRSIYLPISETFIYNELTHLKKSQAIVCTKARENTSLFPFPRVYVYRNRSHLKTILYKKKVNLIHARFGMTGVDVMGMKKKLKLPLLTSFHGSDLPTNKKRKSSYRKKLKLLYKQGDLFTVPSINMKKILVNHGCPKNKIVVHYSGIDLERFTFQPRYMPSHGRVTILSVGRLVEKKGMKYLIDAFKRVQQVYPNVQLRIVGEGRQRAKLEKRVKNKKLQGKVKFLGSLPHDEVLQEMNNAHIFVLASIKAKNGNQEGIPNAIKEAMASGLPVVSTWHAGIPELVEDHKTGYLVPERNKEKLAKAILTLIMRPYQWSQMGWLGHETVARKFNMHLQNKKLEQIYQELVSKSKKKRR